MLDTANNAPTVESSMSFFVLLQIAFAHIGVSIGIVVVNSFLNSELRFNGWSPSIISIYLGTAILFELSRIFAGRNFDKAKSVKLPLTLSIILIVLGIGILPFYVTPVGNLWIIPILGLFFIGSAIISTLVDSVLTVISNPSNRTHVAGILQTLRLSGFALGGITGAIIYPRVDFPIFCIIMSVLCGITVLISLIRIFTIENNGMLNNQTEQNTSVNSIKDLIPILKQKRPLLMAIFLILYPLGLFMQDLILETFTIDNFNFTREGVGRVVIVWSTLTLIFVPVGVKLEGKYFSRRTLGISGALIGAVGLIMISTSTLNISFRLGIFFVGLVLFGVGNGLISAPVIALMLDISAEQKSFTSMLLGFYGVLLTLGRFNAAWMSGLILYLSNEAYVFVFTIEAMFLILTCIPIHFLTLISSEIENEIQNHDGLSILTDLN